MPRRVLLTLALGFVLLAAGLWWALGPAPRVSVETAGEASPREPQSSVQRGGRPFLAPIQGQGCEVKGVVRGGPAERVLVQSPRAGVDQELAIEGDHFGGSLPEQGVMRVVAVAADGRTATVEGECGGDGLLQVVLVMPAIDPNAGTLLGRCLYLETGLPVPSAVLRAAIGEAELATVAAVTDSQGSFRLPLPAGSYRVRCAKDAEDGAPRRVLIDARRVTRTDLYVESRAGVAGRVRADGKPVANALVTARAAREGVDPTPVNGRSDTDGRFLLSGVLPGAVIVEAQAEGRFAEAQTVAKVELPYAAVELELQASALAVEGLVISSTGEPIEGARLSAYATDPNLSLERRTLSGPGGEFSLGGLVPGRFRVRAEAQGHSSKDKDVDLKREPIHVEILLDKACERSVAVLPATPAVAVRVSAKKPDEHGTRVEAAGMSGERIPLRGMVGMIELSARTVGATVRTATRTLDLCNAPDPIELFIGPRQGTGDLIVHVRDAEKQPVIGVEVWRAGGGSARTDAEGVARFLGLKPDKYLVGARDAKPQRIDVAAGGTTEVELEVARIDGQVRGLVQDRGASVEGARILAACSDSGRSQGLEDAALMARSDGEGRFAFSSESGSVCRVRAEHPSKGRSAPATLRAGGELGILALLHGARISGRVISAETGAPVAPCSVSVVSVGGAAEVEGRTVYVAAASGAFTVEDVTPGRVGLAVVGEQGRGRIELELSAGEDKQGVELKVFSRGEVVGRVLGKDGRPIPGANVSVQSGGKVQAKGQTGGDGRFALECSAGAVLQVFATAPTYYPKGSLPFDLIPGAPTDIGPITLDPRGGPEEKEGGIGVMFSNETSGIRIMSFVDNSPAREAGLLAGDLITAINGTPFGREPIVNWVVTLRGRAGTTVQLEIERGTQPHFSVSVVRRAVGLPPVPEDADP